MPTCWKAHSVFPYVSAGRIEGTACLCKPPSHTCTHAHTEYSGDIPCQGNLQSLAIRLSKRRPFQGQKCYYHFHGLVTETWRPCSSQEPCSHWFKVKSHISVGNNVLGRSPHQNAIMTLKVTFVHSWKDTRTSKL